VRRLLVPVVVGVGVLAELAWLAALGLVVVRAPYVSAASGLAAVLMSIGGVFRDWR
jgi:hypothetical protein